MGQIEVYEFLKAQRSCGNHQFWTIKEVVKALKEQGMSNGSLEGVKGDLVKLELAHYLDGLVQRNGWNRAWRIKLKYVNKESKRVNVDKGDKV